MPSITDIAICIRRWDYSETSQTVSLLGRSHGILRGIVKGAKRAKGKFAGGIDLLTNGQIVAILKPNTDLAIITEWTLQEMYRGPRDNLEANRAGLYMADLVHHLLHEHDPHPNLFDIFSKSLSALEDAELISITLLNFQWAILCETGFKPELDHDAQTGELLDNDESTYAFSSAAGGVVADTGTGDRWRVRSETIKLLRNVAADQSEIESQPATVDRANRLLAAYIREVIGIEPNARQWAFPEK